mmetsp:Transcript_137/g.367  ORF Transcript_137/g.367 Transcript_137/m.367 type:complete len:392 (-) Transcript_137:46-1221(-)
MGNAMQCCAAHLDSGAIIDELSGRRPTMPPSASSADTPQAAQSPIPAVREGLTSRAAAAMRASDSWREQGARPKVASGVGAPAEGEGDLVQVAATEILRVAGIAAYHTSIIVGNEEYYFDAEGIATAPALWSHVADSTADGPDMTCTEVVEVARTHTGGPGLIDALHEFFPEESYDILLKNCNAFTDAALYFLTGKRLDRRFTRLERFLAGTRPASTGIISAALRISGFTADLGSGQGSQYYIPNPSAEGFCIEDLVRRLDKLSGSPPGERLPQDTTPPDATKASDVAEAPCAAVLDSILSVCLRSGMCCEEGRPPTLGDSEWYPMIATDEVAEDFVEAIGSSGSKGAAGAAGLGRTPVVQAGRDFAGRRLSRRRTSHPKVPVAPRRTILF